MADGKELQCPTQSLKFSFYGNIFQFQGLLSAKVETLMIYFLFSRGYVLQMIPSIYFTIAPSLGKFARWKAIAEIV